MGNSDFSLRALYDAIDAQRQARQLSWAAVSGEINRFEKERHPVASSTIKGIATNAVAEGDGVLQLLLWLKRSPESFIPDFPNADDERYRLPEIATDRILRFDVKTIHSALEGERKQRSLSWMQVATEIGGHTPAMLTRLEEGGRVGFPGVMRITRWLNRPAVEFTHASIW